MTGKGYDQISTPRRIGNAELDSSSMKADRPMVLAVAEDRKTSAASLQANLMCSPCSQPDP